MTDFYCDISAVGNEYQVYNDVPTTWGVPQDGNGKAGPGHSAAVAIAVIDCTSAVGDGAQTLSILGVTVSNASAASGATLAASLVTSINGTATATTATYCQALLPLNKLIYARQKPDELAKIQVMMRIAGVDWNGMAPTHAGFTTGPTITAFAGGADGPFGYMTNSTTIFGKTYGNYGLMFQLSPGPTEPSVTTDIIHVRTQRSSVNLGYSLTISASLYFTWKNRIYLFDNGTVWSGDNGKLTATITVSGGYTVELFVAASGYVGLFSSGLYNFEVLAACTNSGGAFALLSAGGDYGSFVFYQGRFIENVTNTSGGLRISSDQWSSRNELSQNVINSFVQHRGTSKQIVVYGGGSNGSACLNGTVVEVVAATTQIAAVVNWSNSSNYGKIEWIGGEIRDSNGVYKCVSPVVCNTGCNNIDVVIDGVLGVTDASLGVVASGTKKIKLWWNSPEGPNKAFRFETPQVVVDWKGDGTFPHCGAQNIQGEYWSQRVTWGSIPSRKFAVTPLKLSYNFRDSPGTKTIEVELYSPDATTIYDDEIQATVAYIDSSSVWRVESSVCVPGKQLLTSGRTALTSSAKSWTANGVASFSAKKLSVTTGHPVKQNSEMIISVSLRASRGSPIVIYVSPEPTVS